SWEIYDSPRTFQTFAKPLRLDASRLRRRCEWAEVVSEEETLLRKIWDESYVCMFDNALSSTAFFFEREVRSCNVVQVIDAMDDRADRSVINVRGKITHGVLHGCSVKGLNLLGSEDLRDHDIGERACILSQTEHPPVITQQVTICAQVCPHEIKYNIKRLQRRWRRRAIIKRLGGS